MPIFILFQRLATLIRDSSGIAYCKDPITYSNHIITKKPQSKNTKRFCGSSPTEWQYFANKNREPVSSPPIIMVYSFIQKYFVKDIMLGAVKG